MLRGKIAAYENDLKLNEQLICSLEKQLQETKESLQKVQNLNSDAMESQLDKFNQERKEQ